MLAARPVAGLKLTQHPFSDADRPDSLDGEEAMKEKEMGGWWEKIFLGVLLFVFFVLAVALLSVMCCDSAEKFIVQLLGVEEPKKYEALKFLGIGLGGVLLAVQAVIANRRAKAMEKQANAQADSVGVQAGAVREQASANQATEQGRRQDRLKDAIDHLGHESDSVRLGSAHELFQLAQDTPGFRVTVLSILCAHIRRTTGEDEYQKKYTSKPSEEIQSLLSLLFVQKHEVFTGLDINLQGSWLNGSDLKQARLAKADLGGAELHRADLWGAQLHGARLIETRLHGARLWRAQLHGADLSRAELHGADLWRARLPGACLWGAELYGARRLWGTELPGTLLIETRLNEADLSGGVRLSGACIRPEETNEPFEALINRRIGKQSDLSRAISAGGLTQEAVASIGHGLSDEDAKGLREKLEAHIGKPVIQDLPKSSDVITEPYTAADAAQWIAEYKTATSAVAEGDG